VKLDYELDADLIVWMEDQPRGALSQAIRNALRKAIEGERLIEQQAPDYEVIRQIVADELTQALTGLRFQAHHDDDVANASEAEDQYGARLDQLLGGLSGSVRAGEE
jgi:hypothetical protein